MNSEFELQYRSMNVEYLLADEIEHELLIRQVAFKTGESIDAKKRKLRNKLRELRETNIVTLAYFENPAECEDELNRVDEKLAKIRDQLENRKPKKAELPVLKTRLIHLLFRLDRLKKNFDTAGLESIAMKMLNDQFSLLSVDPDARKRTEEQIRAELSNASIRYVESEPEEPDDSDDESILESVPKRNKKRSKSRKRISSTPKLRRKRQVKAKSTEEIMKKMLKHVEQCIESKLSSLDVNDRESKDRNIETNDFEGNNEKMKEVKIRKPKVSVEKPKKRNYRKVTSSSSDDTFSDNDSEESYAPKRSPRSVADWRMKYDCRDEGKRLNKFITEVEFMAEAENMGKRALFTEAIHLFSGDART
ncbi:probable replication factor C subunit 1 [Sabethes cyaneus]|uniref:probable replication factor C subunit 1 n=1 Tax=Sabethes cyaneus TaxID=53552 RepID=UPI00237E53D8|nr:probable replication factor C subunit 1 [Sabethes cyaneus]